MRNDYLWRCYQCAILSYDTWLNLHPQKANCLAQTVIFCDNALQNVRILRVIANIVQLFMPYDKGVSGKGSKISNVYLTAYARETKKYTHKRTNYIWNMKTGKHFNTNSIDET